MDSLYIQCMRKMYYNNTVMFIFFVNLERKFVHCILLFQRCFEKFDVLSDAMDKNIY